MCVGVCVCMYAKSLQSCLTLCHPIDYSLPDSSVHGILPARILEWVAIPSSRGSSWPRDQTCISYVSCTGRQVLYHSVQFSSVQSLSRVWLPATPWITACQASLSITNSWSSPKVMCILWAIPSSHLILCHPLLLLPPLPPIIRVFSN